MSYITDSRRCDAERTMWIFSTIGFFSIVGFPAHSNRPDDVMVRCREKSQLSALRDRFPALAGCVLLDQAGSDYRWRIVAPRRVMAQVMFELTDDIDYNNFKSECAGAMHAGRLSAAYEHALHQIWSVMARTQETPPYAGVSKSTVTTPWYGSPRAVSGHSTLPQQPSFDDWYDREPAVVSQRPGLKKAPAVKIRRGR